MPKLLHWKLLKKLNSEEIVDIKDLTIITMWWWDFPFFVVNLIYDGIKQKCQMMSLHEMLVIFYTKVMGIAVKILIQILDIMIVFF